MAKTKAAAKKKPARKRISKSAEYVLPPGRALGLRTCGPGMLSYNGFRWPEAGLCEPAKWDPSPTCGDGLHFLLWAVGDAEQLNHTQTDRRWLVVEVEASEVVHIQDGASVKAKAPRAWVVYCGERDGALALIAKHAPAGSAMVFGTATAGTRGTATAGDAGTATAGDAGTATAGDAGTATAGDAGTATAGDAGTATAGDAGTATAGDAGTATAGTRGTATAGDAGTATAGYAGTATAGDAGTATAGDAGTATAGTRGTATAGTRGTATAGYAGTATAGYAGTATAGTRGTATAGDAGTATAGYAGTATAGLYGCLAIEWYDAKRNAYRKAVAEVDGERIKPGVAYVVRDGVLVEKVP